jgi:hypothetical protein
MLICLILVTGPYDADGDGLSFSQEVVLGTNPDDPDSGDDNLNAFQEEI